MSAASSLGLRGADVLAGAGPDFAGDAAEIFAASCRFCARASFAIVVSATRNSATAPREDRELFVEKRAYGVMRPTGATLVPGTQTLRKMFFR